MPDTHLLWPETSKFSDTKDKKLHQQVKKILPPTSTTIWFIVSYELVKTIFIDRNGLEKLPQNIFFTYQNCSKHSWSQSRKSVLRPTVSTGNICRHKDDILNKGPEIKTPAHSYISVNDTYTLHDRTFETAGINSYIILADFFHALN